MKTEELGFLLEDEMLVIKSLQLAYEYHEGQVDKAGMPYFDHCMRVGIKATERATSAKERLHLAAIGFSHDLLEDTEITEEGLLLHLKNEKVVEAVKLLTRIEGQTYFEYIDQLSHNRLATLVKLADLDDHLTKRDGFTLPESLRIRYEKAQEQLLKAIELH